MRMDMAERVRQLQAEGETEFHATYKVSILEFAGLAQQLEAWSDPTYSQAVRSSGIYRHGIDQIVNAPQVLCGWTGEGHVPHARSPQ
mmetsp:Transcript_35697/g.101044  ORF Transcript_35697/g.101044 Transcript_35697/m.101044 type:complete len:87 (-) Transcript_35697:137-397(-)